VGRYNEPRLLYTAPLFATSPHPLDERRTIHLGLDLFVAAGTPVHAPLPGTVHATANNDAPLTLPSPPGGEGKGEGDYGPVVLLRHQTSEGQTFFPLYGHLSLESLAELRVGQVVAAGPRLGAPRAPRGNGRRRPPPPLLSINPPLRPPLQFLAGGP